MSRNTDAHVQEQTASHVQLAHARDPTMQSSSIVTRLRAKVGKETDVLEVLFVGFSCVGHGVGHGVGPGYAVAEASLENV